MVTQETDFVGVLLCDLGEAGFILSILNNSCQHLPELKWEGILAKWLTISR